MRRYELFGALLLAAASAWPQAAGPGPASAPVPPPQGAAPGGAPAAPGSGVATPADPAAVNPDATGFDAATIQRVAEHRLRFGTLADGLRQVEAWAEAGDLPAARLLAQTLLAPDALSSWRAELELADSRVLAPLVAGAEPVLDWLGFGGRTRGERAHVRYALGQLDLVEELPERAVGEFEAVRVAADEQGLRGDAIYNLGTLALQEGELWRSQIPELGGQPAPPTPGGPAAPGAEEEPPDPLEQARAHYLQAKGHYVERLRLDFQDEDTRANTELVFRRLRELEELERQREEQQQQEQQESDESEDEQEPEDQQQDQQDQQQDQQDQQDQQEPQDGEPQEPEPQEEEPEPEDPQEQEGESQEGEPEESEAQPQPRDEQYLTKEEVQRLLDRLEQHEELGKQLLERQRQARRGSSARDW